MDRLFALPVAGESFLLQRNGKNILVDGGYGSSALATALLKTGTAAAELDIVVCTHADEDHAGGLTHLLDKSSVKVKEFWLPGEWGDALPDLLQDPKRVVDGLVRELDSANRHVGGSDESYEDFEARVHRELAAEWSEWRGERSEDVHAVGHRDPQDSAGLEWLKRHTHGLDLGDASVAEAAARTFENGRRKVRHRKQKGLVGHNWAMLWLDAIKTAERIREIAVQAIRHNVRVRWFDFNAFAKSGQPSGGDPDVLVPWNAMELLEPPQPALALRYLARLSAVNEQSLVFSSPSPHGNWWHSPDVVFTGDSPLGIGTNYANSFLGWIHGSPRRWAIATAPHHGSENNRMAYAHLSAVRRVMLWIRSGGSVRQPGQTFKNLSPHVRACMHCPQKSYERALAEVQLDWHYPCVVRVKSHDCCC